MSIVVRLEEHHLDPREELGLLLDRATGDGGVVSFVGVARPTSDNGDDLERLILEHHPVLTLQSLEEIALAAVQRFDVHHVRVAHRCGNIGVGEPIVFAGAAATHRRAAFEAADYLMDRLKTEAIFWKREERTAGHEWIEPTAADYRERERWG